MVSEVLPHKYLAVGGLRKWVEASPGLRAFPAWSSTTVCFRRYVTGTEAKMVASGSSMVWIAGITGIFFGLKSSGPGHSRA